MEQTACLEFPIPNEIIDIVLSYLSPEELLDLAAIATERLKTCTFRALRKKSRGKYQFMKMLSLILFYSS